MRQLTDEESLVGREIAGYRVTGLIGQGGMGVVYLAEHVRLERRVALKLLPRQRSQDAGYRSRFLRESRLAAALDHPNVVPVHDADEADGQLYIAMRYVDGRDLRSLLADGSLEPQRAVAVASQIAAALDAAHARGLVHRDVKPANILVGDADHAYLTDFGIAVEVDAPAAGLGSTAGTLAYLAPEQIDGQPVDGRADQYALACVLFECLAGHPPFAGQSSRLALLWAHMEEPPPALSGAAPGVPAALDAVLERGLAKQPAARYASCEALIAGAREALASAATGTAAGRARRACAAPGRSRGRGRGAARGVAGGASRRRCADAGVGTARRRQDATGDRARARAARPGARALCERRRGRAGAAACARRRGRHAGARDRRGPRRRLRRRRRSARGGGARPAGPRRRHVPGGGCSRGRGARRARPAPPPRSARRRRDPRDRRAPRRRTRARAAVRVGAGGER